MHYDKYRIALKHGKIVTIEMNGHEVRCFGEPATKNHLPKLYVVKHGPDIIYVGATSQSTN